MTRRTIRMEGAGEAKSSADMTVPKPNPRSAMATIRFRANVTSEGERKHEPRLHTTLSNMTSGY
jgi:hypothetical protein